MRIRKVYLAKIRMAVINEVMAGTLSKEDAKRKYGIRGKSTVLNWIRKFEDSQSNYMSKTDQNPSSKRVQELEAENKRLLEELQM
jgi:transposase